MSIGRTSLIGSGSRAGLAAARSAQKIACSGSRFTVLPRSSRIASIMIE